MPVSYTHLDVYKRQPLEMDYQPRKIKLPESAVKKEPFAVRKYHIDTNEHVNNCQYVQMAMEYIEHAGDIRQVRVEYKNSAVYGDITVSYTHLEHLTSDIYREGRRGEEGSEYADGLCRKKRQETLLKMHTMKRDTYRIKEEVPVSYTHRLSMKVRNWMNPARNKLMRSLHSLIHRKIIGNMRRRYIRNFFHRSNIERSWRRSIARSMQVTARLIGENTLTITGKKVWRKKISSL